MPDLTQLIDGPGWVPYVIVLVWTFFEGETIVILAGVAAQDGTPHLWLLILCAFCGSLCGDQLAFFLGRFKGKGFVARRPRLQEKAAKVYRILEKHQTLLIIGFRFLYGLRNITPFAIGMTEVRTSRFLILNITGAAVWAVTFSFTGYLLGHALSGMVAAYGEVAILSLLLFIVIAYWIIRLTYGYERRRRQKQLAPPPAAS